MIYNSPSLAPPGPLNKREREWTKRKTLSTSYALLTVRKTRCKHSPILVCWFRGDWPLCQLSFQNTKHSLWCPIRHGTATAPTTVVVAIPIAIAITPSIRSTRSTTTRNAPATPTSSIPWKVAKSLQTLSIHSHWVKSMYIPKVKQGNIWIEICNTSVSIFSCSENLVLPFWESRSSALQESVSKKSSLL